MAEATATIRRYDSGVSFVDVENPTRFHCHAKVASRFRSGPVLLAGDAAHLCSPAEGHGMNGGLQDAINLAWTRARMTTCAAEPALLDSYEAERRPVAEMVIQSGEATEHAQTLTDPAERDSRDNAMRAAFASRGAASRSRGRGGAERGLLAIANRRLGDANVRLGPGQRLPDSIRVRRAGAGSCGLHELTHRAGHTLVLLGGASAGGLDTWRTCSRRARFVTDASLFEAAVAFGTRGELPDQDRGSQLAAADLLGVEGITLLVARPDGYIGLRADRDHVSALERYRALVHTGNPYSVILKRDLDVVGELELVCWSRRRRRGSSMKT